MTEVKVSILPKRKWQANLTPEQLKQRNRTRNEYYKHRRQVLLAQKPYCHWCGRKVLYYKLKFRERMPKDFATIDHLTSRFHGPRPNVYGRRQTLVLACHECNQRRCEEETKSIPKWKLWIRSKAFPWYLGFMKIFYKSKRK